MNKERLQESLKEALHGLNTDQGLPISTYKALSNMVVEIFDGEAASNLHEVIRYQDDWAYISSDTNLDEILK